jgi:hypothetical protein
MKSFLGLVMAVALISPARAMVALAPGARPAGPTILIEGGCGRDYHRDEHGNCRPNWREWDGRRCPPGWHLGPEGHRCWPN